MAWWLKPQRYAMTAKMQVWDWAFFWVSTPPKGSKRWKYLAFFFPPNFQGASEACFLFFCFVVKDQNTSNITTPVKIVAWKMILSFLGNGSFFWKGWYSLVFPGGVCKALTVGRHHRSIQNQAVAPLEIDVTLTEGQLMPGVGGGIFVEDSRWELRWVTAGWNWNL